MQDLNDKIIGDNLTAAEWNQVPSEIQNVIEGTGQTLSGADLNQLGKGVAEYAANGSFYTDSGAANAYVLGTVGLKQAPSAYVDGMLVTFRASNTNTGASTVNVGGLGVKNIKDNSGNDIVSGAIQPGDYNTVLRYDSVNGWFTLVPNSGLYVVGDKAEAQSLAFIDRKVVFVASSDGGVFSMVTGAAPGTYSEDSSIACGTVILPSGGDGSAALLRVLPGKFVVPEMFGAVADGVTDDQTALEAAEHSAYDNGLELRGRPGSNYAFSSRFSLRVSIDGHDCTFTPLSIASSYDTISNYNSGTGFKATDITLENFTVAPANRTRGVYLADAHRCEVRNVTVNGPLAGGIAVYGGDDVIVSDCYISGVVYEPGGTGAADGIYLAGCNRAVARGNKVTDFRRIGIVSESNGAVKSFNPSIMHNRVWNANNCDDSTTEFNAAIWCENTNGGTIAHNICWDLSGNAGQTSGRIRGVTVHALGDDSGSLVLCLGNRVDGAGYTVGGSGAYADILMDGNYSADPQGTGESGSIAISAGLKSVTVRDHRFDGVSVGDTGSDGLVIMDFSVAADPVRVTLDNLGYSNLVVGADTDWSHIIIFSGGPAELSILNCRGDGWSLHNRGSSALTGEMNVVNSSILFGTAAGYGCLEGANISVASSTIKPFGARSGRLFSANGAASAVLATGSLFENVSFEWAGTNYVDATFSGCDFVGGQLQLNMSAGWTVRFDGCRVEEYSATNGFIYTNFNNSSPNDRLFIRNCDFRRSTDVTPIVVWNYQPTVTVLAGNTTTATALHDFTTPTQDANNVTSVAY